ncbi:MAG: OmpA family protein [Chitinophagales bacterium]|nr:OmpA family protein [Chitinophagales bacterium]
MGIRNTAILTAFCTLLFYSQGLYSQENHYRLTDKVLQESDESFSKGAFSFVNLSSTTYYRDEKKIKELAKLEEAKDFDKLIPALEGYISHFAGENFGQDYQLMWRLAQLYEKKGRTADAKWLYRILLRHSASELELIARYYDSLDINDKDYYVPIKYYYELVDYRRQVDTLHPPQGVFLNMGDVINSDFEDYGPSLSPDDQLLMFGTKRNRRMVRNETYINEDIYFSQRNQDGWDTAKPLEGINTQFNEGAPCLSRDGKTLYFVRCESPDGLGRCDIYTAERDEEGKWTNIKNLGTNVNSSDWDSHPSLSHSEDTLYFTSDRPGGFGSNDIYFTVKGKNGQWQPAKNLGPVINTKGNDLSPFYHPIYDVLYFASNSQVLNFGNFDIYKSRLVNGQWQEPKNIGPLVNGWGDENFFAIDAESKNLFYARTIDDNFKNTDLFSFPLPMEAQPLAYTVFKGSLTDSVTGEPFKGIVSVIDMDRGIEVAPKFIRPDGSFEFDLIDSSKYLLVIQGEDFFRIEKLIDLNGDTTVHYQTPSINFVRLQFASVEFASNSAEITDEMRPDLEKMMDFLLDNPSTKLVISGHTDANGNAEMNLDLSYRRANAIKEFLVSTGGIDPIRIDAKGYGSSKPIIKDEQTEEDRKINRRVEFELIKGEEEAIDSSFNGSN